MSFYNYTDQLTAKKGRIQKNMCDGARNDDTITNITNSNLITTVNFRIFNLLLIKGCVPYTDLGYLLWFLFNF